MVKPYRILLADDQPVIRECVRMILAEKSDLEVIGEVGDGLDDLAFRHRVVRLGPCPCDDLGRLQQVPHLGETTASSTSAAGTLRTGHSA